MSSDSLGAGESYESVMGASDILSLKDQRHWKDYEWNIAHSIFTSTNGIPSSQSFVSEDTIDRRSLKLMLSEEFLCFIQKKYNRLTSKKFELNPKLGGAMIRLELQRQEEYIKKILNGKNFKLSNDPYLNMLLEKLKLKN